MLVNENYPTLKQETDFQNHENATDCVKFLQYALNYSISDLKKFLECNSIIFERRVYFEYFG